MRRTCLILAVGFVLLGAPLLGQSMVYFDDAGSDRVRLGNDFFELQLSKENGAVLDLRDTKAGASLTLGSRGGCLWGAVFESAPSHSVYVGGCSFAASWGNRYTYSWDATRSTLTLKYTFAKTASRQVNAEVTITATAGHTFDMRLALQNLWGYDMTRALFPSDWVHSDTSVDAAYFPFQLPGIRLRPSFFVSNRSLTSVYPGMVAFADFFALDIDGGQLAVYSVNPTGALAPVVIGFLDDDATKAGTFQAVHSFETAVPHGGNYSTPTIRVCVGQSPRESVLGYRVANRIDTYPAVRQKLGNRFDTLARAPLIKADWSKFFKVPFRSGIRALDALSAPAIFHIAGYMSGGHGCNFPDFLPPDPRWGSTADLKALIDAARARGLLVMPYINPTWWNPESPTMQNLPKPLGPTDISVIDKDGKPVYEVYDLVQGGYAVSPYVPFVHQRSEQLMAEWRTVIPVDYLFLDQIGARSWLRDLNPASPTRTSYSTGWLELMEQHTSQSLMTEDGWDRLAADTIGFCGSPLTDATGYDIGVQRFGFGSKGNKALGIGNWDPYPLATWMLHDKVVMYQHDLDEGATTQNLEAITWNLAFGVVLGYVWSYDPEAFPWPTSQARIELANALQRAVARRYVGAALSEFTYLTAEVTRSTFGELSVIANWHQTQAYVVDGSGIVPGGYLARTGDGSVVAGSCAGTFNGGPLSAGTHFIVIEHAANTVIVRQPDGADTDLLVGGCSNGVSYARALDANGTVIGNVSFTTVGTRAQLNFARTVAGQTVDRYELGCRPARPRRHLARPT